MPVSARPRKKRVARRPLQFFTRPWQMVTRPKRNMQADSHTWGLSLFKTIFDGISKTMYGIKNMVKAVLYCVPVSFKSVWRLNTDALAMLVRSRKASRYMRLRTGITRRSILETSLRWEVCDGHLAPRSSSYSAPGCTMSGS